MAGPLNIRAPFLAGVLLLIRAPILAGVLLLFALLRFPLAANAAPGTPPSNEEPPRMVQARDLFETSQYAKADSVGRLALEDVEKLHGPRSLVAADLLDLLVRNAWKGKRTKDPKFKELAQRAVAIREKLQGETHSDLATSVYLQATLLRVSGDYESAAPVYERALSLRERIDGPSSRALGDVLNGYGQLLHRQGRLEEARAKLERSAEIFSKIEPPQNEALAYSLVNLANVLRDLDDLSGARTNAERALGLLEKELGKDEPGMTPGLVGLGHVLFLSGDYDGALAMYQRELDIAVKSQGPDGPPASDAHTHLAVVHKHRGDYAEAKFHCERAIAIDEIHRGPDYPQIASSLNTLGTIHLAMGSYDEAQMCFERSRMICEKTLGPEHSRVAQALENLGRVQSARGNEKEARALIEKAIAIQEKTLGPHSEELASGLQGLSEILRSEGSYSEAKRVCERSLQIREKNFGARNPLTAEVRREMGRILLESGETAPAREVLARVAADEEASLGPLHPDLAETLSLLARAEMKSGRSREAFEAAIRAERISRENLATTARVLSERQALDYESVRAGGLAIALEIAATQPEAERTRAACDALIRSRALVLDEIAARHRTVQNAEDPEIDALSLHFERSRRKLANLIARDAAGENAKSHARLIEEARHEKETAERAIAAQSAAFRSEAEERALGLAEVARALPPESVLIAYVRTESPKMSFYAAFVLRAGEKDPILVSLGDRSRVDAAVAAWNVAIETSLSNDRASSSPPGATLREIIWDPLEKHLAGAKRVFLVPDGSLNLVSFAALPRAKNEFLIDHYPLMHYLSAERDLAIPSSVEKGAEGILLVGAPDFDAAHSSESKDGMTVVAAALLPGSAPLRGLLPDCAPFSSLRFEPLPGADREVKSVEKLWKKTAGSKSHSKSAQRLGSRAANEAAVKAKAPGHEVLHLATHAFVLDPHCAAVGAAQDVAANPLLLAGLALAGANHRQDALPHEENGILTAEEIASLDLHGTQWVVLSACRSGAGEIVAGEGVFGLRRAFHVAGARTILTSLWPVDDDAAQEWIDALYEARLRDRLSTDAAVSKASLAVLNALRRKGRTPHPFLWGNFIASGDWR